MSQAAGGNIYNKLYRLCPEVSTRVCGIHHVMPVKHGSDMSTFVRRYTDLPFLFDYLRTKGLALLSPKTWDDKNDSFFVEQYAKAKGFQSTYARQMQVVVDPLESQAKVYRAIMDSDVLPVETRQLIQNLRQLRNQVAHAQVVPNPESAQDYLVAIERVVELIRNYRKNLPGYRVDVR